MVQKRNALGKGLSALISDELEKIDEKSVSEIDLQMIKPNPNQPRNSFDDEKIQELAESIKLHGVIQPVILKKGKEFYEIIAGERRWRAARIAKLRTIPAIVRDIDNRSVEEIALIENIQRENLNPVDEAKAYKVLMDRYSITQEEVSRIVGKSRSYVANLLRLLNLPDFVTEMIYNNTISQGHGKILLGIDEITVKKITDKIVNEKLSVRDTEKIVSKLKKTGESKDKKTKLKDPNILYIEDILTEELSTRVEIKRTGKKGKISVHFSDDAELDRIINLISDKFK